MEKLSKLIGVRLTDADRLRLEKQCRASSNEPVEFIRNATLEQLAKLEAEDALRQITRLRDAGIDLKSLVDYALARQAAEAAQANLPGLFAAREQGGRR